MTERPARSPATPPRRSIRPGPRTVVLAALALGLLVAAGCRFPQSTFQPHSDFARLTDELTRSLVLWVAGIFLVVEAVLLGTILRFRARRGATGDAGPPAHGHTALEIAWTVVPALILTAVAIPTVAILFRTQAQAPPRALEIRVIGHQWWWEFRYPHENVVTANEVHVPLGRPVAFTLESADVIHSFWVPAMGGKRDVVPGRVNALWFTPTTVGDFPGECAEFCGVSHANMRLHLVVQSPRDYAAWLRAQAAPPAEPDSASPAGRGRQTFMTVGCAGCHTVRGVSPGQIGPDLTHLASRGTIASGLYANTPENLAHWIEDPPGRKPGALMPKLGLPPAQIADVVAYLRTLR
jgi:cytochrome c oxidase subunit II